MDRVARNSTYGHKLGLINRTVNRCEHCEREATDYTTTTNCRTGPCAGPVPCAVRLLLTIVAYTWYSSDSLTRVPYLMS